MADARHGADQLRDGDHADRQAKVDLPAREDDRHDRRQQQLGEELHAARQEGAQHVTQFLLNTLHAVEEIDDEHGRANDDEHEGNAELHPFARAPRTGSSTRPALP